MSRVSVYLSFTINALLLNAEVKDSHIKDIEKDWRYDDGFYIYFTAPQKDEKKSTDKFVEKLKERGYN